MNRIITGIIVAVFWFAIIYANSHILLWGTLCIFCLTTFIEFLNISSPEEHKYHILSAVIGLLPLFLSYFGSAETVLAGFFLALLTYFSLALSRYAELNSPFQFVVVRLFGTAYISIAASFLVLLQHATGTSKWLLLLTAIIISSDTGAYYLGKSFGKRQFSRNVSPKKTVEGFVGGLLCAATAGALTLFLINKTFPDIQTVFFLIIIAVAGVLGDLAESILKRSYKVKDSGAILPGHGGLLDRIDSYLFAGPLMYYLVHYEFLAIVN